MLRSHSVAGLTDLRRDVIPAVGVARIGTLGQLDAVIGRLEQHDLARLRRTKSEKRTRELLAGRWLLQAFSQHLGLPPVVFDSAERDAGVVVRTRAQAESGLSASVTHAGEWVGCALGYDGGIGVDLEVLTDRDFIALAEASFPEAANSIRGLPPNDRKVEFYRRWTQHEAAIKRGARPGNEASWLLPGEWVLSLNWSSCATLPTVPYVWVESDRAFRLLTVEALYVC